MSKQTSLFSVVMLTVLLIDACVPAGISFAQVGTKTAPTKTPILVPDIQSEDYMAGCLELSPNRHQGQIGFQGVYPGKTSIIEIENLLGAPLQILDGYGPVSSTYQYDDFVVDFDKAGVVLDIFVDLFGDTLKSLIAQYGCPQVLWTAYHVDGEQWTFLAYPDLGFQIEIKGYPVSWDENIIILTYFVPTTITDYFKSSVNSAYDDKLIVSWDDAIR